MGICDFVYTSLFVYIFCFVYICLCEVLLLTIYLLACHCVYVFVLFKVSVETKVCSETLSVLSVFLLSMCSHFCMCMQPTNNLKGLVDLT